MTHLTTSATWHEVGLVLRSPWQLRRNRGMYGLLAAFGFVPTLLPLLMSVVHPIDGPMKFLLPFVLVPLVTCGLGVVWAAVAFDVLVQNDPQLARVVPGQVHALRIALWSGASVLSGIAALAFSPLKGWPVPAFCCMAAGCAALPYVFRWPLLAWVLLAAWFGAPLWSGTGAFGEVAQAWRAAPWLQAPMTAALAAIALGAVVMTGGKQHAKSHARLVGMASAFSGRASRGASAPPTSRLATWLYSGWMLRQLARAGSPLRSRLALGLGAAFHGSGLLAGALGWVLSVLAFVLIRSLYPQWDGVWNGVPMLRDAVVLFIVVPVAIVPTQVAGAMWLSRREQVLLRLLPGTPQGVDLNRWLALRVASLQMIVLIAELGALLLLLSSDYFPASWDKPMQFALACVVLGPVFVLGMWRDWSRLKAPSGLSMLPLVATAACIAGGSLAWVYKLEGQWWSLAGIGGLIFAVLGMWRWRAIKRFPVAWPAGRF